MLLVMLLVMLPACGVVVMASMMKKKANKKGKNEDPFHSRSIGWSLALWNARLNQTLERTLAHREGEDVVSSTTRKTADTIFQ